MTEPKITVNVYCTEPDDRVIPWSCPCCNRCWKFVAGGKTGSCPFGGPFNGYRKMEE